MKHLEFQKMLEYNAGEKNWLAFACGVGVATLEASFAFPVLFAFTAPLTAGACTAAALDAAIKNSR